MKKASMKEFLNDSLKDQVIDMKNPSCSNCNDCCSMGSMLLFKEYESLRKYFKKDAMGHKIYKEALNRIKKNTTPDTIYWMCPLSNSSRKCSIYSRRPSVCRGFHCTPELAANFDKNNYEEDPQYIIYDLFHKRIKNKKE